MPGCGAGSTLDGIALIDPGQFDDIVGDGLHGTREPLDLAAILRAGRRNVECQQMGDL